MLTYIGRVEGENPVAKTANSDVRAFLFDACGYKGHFRNSGKFINDPDPLSDANLTDLLRSSYSVIDDSVLTTPTGKGDLKRRVLFLLAPYADAKDILYLRTVMAYLNEEASKESDAASRITLGLAPIVTEDELGGKVYDVREYTMK